MPHDTVHGPVELGKLPPKQDRRTLRAISYIEPQALEKAPRRKTWSRHGDSYPMYLNDSLPDCTIAATGHMIQVWTGWATRRLTLTDTAILAAFDATGPRSQGRYLLDVLNYWRQSGIGGDRVDSFALVDPHNHAEVRAALWLFGGLYIGLDLPATARYEKVWKQTVDEPGSWGGHCVNLIGYNSGGLVCVTWGGRLRMTWHFFDRYCDEAYAVLNPDWLGAAGRSPTGLDVAQLHADLATITGGT